MAKQHTLKGGSRWYDTPVGALPSVTTILKAINKPALIQWAANTTKRACIEAAADLYEEMPQPPKLERTTYLQKLDGYIGKARAHIKEMEDAGNIGKKTHAMIEHVLRIEMGQQSEAPKLCQASALAFSSWEKWRKLVDLVPTHIEQVVWSTKNGYAGSMDLYGKLTLPELGRVNAVIDFKTGKAIYNEALLQAAAYAQAYKEMGHGEDSTHGLIVRLPKKETDPPLEVRIITPDEYPVLFRTFLSTLELWRWLNRDQKWLREINEYNRRIAQPEKETLPVVPDDHPDVQPEPPATAGPQTMERAGDVAKRVMANEGTSLTDEQRWARILKVAARRVKDERERFLFIGQLAMVEKLEGIDMAEKAFRESKWGKKHG